MTLQSLLNSTILTNLVDEGKLPSMDVNVSLNSRSLVDLFAGAFFTAVAVLLVIQLIKKL
ncbi:MAG: hypothetical protein ACRYFZ_00995 [Janthinobacterium lividum]